MSPWTQRPPDRDETRVSGVLLHYWDSTSGPTSSRLRLDRTSSSVRPSSPHSPRRSTQYVLVSSCHFPTIPSRGSFHFHPHSRPSPLPTSPQTATGRPFRTVQPSSTCPCLQKCRRRCGYKDDGMTYLNRTFEGKQEPYLWRPSDFIPTGLLHESTLKEGYTGRIFSSE